MRRILVELIVEDDLDQLGRNGSRGLSDADVVQHLNSALEEAEGIWWLTAELRESRQAWVCHGCEALSTHHPHGSCRGAYRGDYWLVVPPKNAPYREVLP